MAQVVGLAQICALDAPQRPVEIVVPQMLKWSQISASVKMDFIMTALLLHAMHVIQVD
jgi:hypothetical protein